MVHVSLTLCTRSEELSPLIFMLLQFLQDILDTLFVILDDNTEKYGLLVFQSLVSLIFPGFPFSCHVFLIERSNLFECQHKVPMFPVEKGLRSIIQEDQPTYQADPYKIKFEEFSMVRSSLNFIVLILNLITTAVLPGP